MALTNSAVFPGGWRSRLLGLVTAIALAATALVMVGELPAAQAATGDIDTVAGGAIQTVSPDAVVVDGDGNLIVTHPLHAVQRIDPVTGDIVIIAGTGTAGFDGDGSHATNAQLNSPGGIGDRRVQQPLHRR